MTKKKPLKRKIKVALKRKSKIFKRSITKKKDLISKKFNTSIKGKKIDIGKSVKNFFDWIKGAEIVELPNCNTNEDPVRPELDNEFRTSFGRKIYGVKYQDERCRESVGRYAAHRHRPACQIGGNRKSCQRRQRRH